MSTVADSCVRKREIFINERNRRVCQKISNWVPGQRIRAVCISAKEYQLRIEGYPAIDRPSISPECSGIPSLKRFITALPCQPRQKQLAHYVELTVPSLLNSIELANFQPIATDVWSIEGGVEGQLEVRVQLS